MSTLLIQYYLHRSNPVNIRYAAVPDRFRADALPRLCCLVFGIDGTDSYVDLCIDSNPELTDTSAAECLTVGMTGVIHLARNAMLEKRMSLDFYWNISEWKDENLSCPVLKGWTGFQLPSGIYNIAIINEMQNAFLSSSCFQMSTGEVLYRDQMQQNLRKTENAIFREYAPDRAKAELRMDLGIPLRDLLGFSTLPVLKWNIERRTRYSAAGLRKAECIARLAKTLEETDPAELFCSMEPSEYRNFRQLVLTGNCPYYSEADLMQEFPVLWDENRIGISKKQGVRLSSDILQYYEKWFDGPGEILLYDQLLIRTAIRWCAFYYGIFSIEHCWNVLESVYPGKVKRVHLDDYWKNLSGYAESGSIRFTGYGNAEHSVKDYAYDLRVIPAEKCELYLKALEKDYSMRKELITRKLPDNPAIFEEISLRSMNYAADNSNIADLLSGCYYYDRQKFAQAIDDGVQALRSGASVEDAQKKATKRHFWGYRELNASAILYDFFQEEADQIPQFLYYGFNRKEIRNQHLEPHLEEIYQALKQEETAQKREQTRLQRQRTRRKTE